MTDVIADQYFDSQARHILTNISPQPTDRFAPNAVAAKFGKHEQLSKVDVPNIAAEKRIAFHDASVFK